MFSAYLFIVTLLLSNGLSFCNDGVGGVEGECKRERREITIEWPNCDETFTKVHTCYGSCRSYDVVIPTAPYFEKQCNCCKSGEHRVRKRKLEFNCKGKKENHTVYIPRIDHCSCVQCEVLSWMLFSTRTFEVLWSVSHQSLYFIIVGVLHCLQEVIVGRILGVPVRSCRVYGQGLWTVAESHPMLKHVIAKPKNYRQITSCQQYQWQPLRIKDMSGAQGR